MPGDEKDLEKLSSESTTDTNKIDTIKANLTDIKNSVEDVNKKMEDLNNSKKNILIKFMICLD